MTLSSSIRKPIAIEAFRTDLLRWYEAEKRDLPWRLTDDPYAIWVSEVMLQQTRVDTVRPYYERFLSRYPTVEALADAPLDDVLKTWEGLGYYSRARNLHRAARELVEKHDGALPDDHQALLQVPGIGPYTAAAVASIAYNRPHPVLDGNVIRVLCRLFRIESDPRSGSSRRRLRELAEELLHPQRASDFNQALMELGACICLPQKPLCSRCPVSPYCQAFKELKDPSVLPKKVKRKPLPHHTIAVGLIWNDGKLLIDQRPEDSMLGGLWEFPGGKVEPGETLEECLAREVREELGIEIEVEEPFVTVKHSYSHFRITLHSFHCRYLGGQPQPKQVADWRWVRLSDLSKFAFPKANKRVLQALEREDLFSRGCR
jgi:A/G-specific adenine glycosylase